MSGMELSRKNTFIFNWVDDYGDKVQQLKEAFENLNDHVDICDHLPYDKLKEKVDSLRRLNFGLFYHVTVIILDNKTKCHRLITTADNRKVMIHTEILSLLKTNRTLNDVSRLFITQKLSDDDVDDDDEGDNGVTDSIENNEQAFKHLHNQKIIYEGLEFSLDASESNNNFNGSPFIDVFCDEFQHSTALPMDEIYKNIRRRVKIDQNYSDIDIVLGFNQRTGESGIIRSGFRSTEEERDFMH